LNRNEKAQLLVDLQHSSIVEKAVVRSKDALEVSMVSVQDQCRDKVDELQHTIDALNQQIEQQQQQLSEQSHVNKDHIHALEEDIANLRIRVQKQGQQLSKDKSKHSITKMRCNALLNMLAMHVGIVRSQ
jgi:molecular chaperone GrpE (heat shock protein)